MWSPATNKRDAMYGEFWAACVESDYLTPSIQEVIESAHRMARATLVYPFVMGRSFDLTPSSVVKKNV